MIIGQHDGTVQAPVVRFASCRGLWTSVDVIAEEKEGWKLVLDTYPEFQKDLLFALIGSSGKKGGKVLQPLAAYLEHEDMAEQQVCVA